MTENLRLVPPPQSTDERLYLKWGTYKGHYNLSETSKPFARIYFEMGMSAAGAMFEDMTDAKRSALCDLICAVAIGGGTIINEWSVERMNAAQACAYVRNYRVD